MPCPALNGTRPLAVRKLTRLCAPLVIIPLSHRSASQQSMGWGKSPLDPSPNKMMPADWKLAQEEDPVLKQVRDLYGRKELEVMNMMDYMQPELHHYIR